MIGEYTFNKILYISSKIWLLTEIYKLFFWNLCPPKTMLSLNNNLPSIGNSERASEPTDNIDTVLITITVESCYILGTMMVIGMGAEYAHNKGHIW